jgi:hypothetical protein
MPDVDAVRALVAHLDPAADRYIDAAARPRGIALLEQVTGPEAPHNAVAGKSRRRHGHRLGVVAVASAGALLAVVFGVIPHLGQTTPTAYAATPRLLHYHASAEAQAAPLLLRQLADRADKQPGSPAGRYQFLDIESWSLWTRVDSAGEGRSRVMPSTVQSWVADDGSGRTVRVQDGRRESRILAPGEWARMYDVATLSTNPAVLTDQLAVGHPIGNGVAERFVAVTDLWKQEAPRPPLQAAMLRVLADQPELVNRGTVTDRAGRKGVAVSVDSAYSGLPTRYTLILDPATGMLLDYEEMLTTTAGELNISIPSVIAYTVWLNHGDVARIGDLPQQ